jgi:UDP-N-acetyl-D-mannosaminuronic acid dehydrogenase
MGCESHQSGAVLSRVVIVGAGYVGLTLGVASARVGHEVFFVDINSNTVEKINQRQATFYEAGLQESLDTLFADKGKIAFKSLGDLYEFTSPKPTVYIISLGTPLGPDSKALLGPVENVAKEVAHYMTDGDLIVLRSTVAVGTSQHLISSIPEITHLSFCPERTIEGKALEELSTLPQIISGNSTTAINIAEAYFLTITPTVIQAATLETAELIKLASNSFRDLNFAFANLLALISEQNGVNVNELISLANFRYDRNLIALPGLVGGPCLEKDAYILAQSFKGPQANLLLEARELNENFVGKAIEFIKRHGTNPETRLLICGAAFKGRPVTSDTRGSFVFKIVDDLIAIGIKTQNIVIYDPKVNEEISGIPVINDAHKMEREFDYMIQLTNHEVFDSEEFDRIFFRNCKHIISFWPMKSMLNNSGSKHLFIGGLKAS